MVSYPRKQPFDYNISLHRDDLTDGALIAYFQPEVHRLKRLGKSYEKIHDHFVAKMGERYSQRVSSHRNFYRWDRSAGESKRPSRVKHPNHWKVNKEIFNAGHIAQSETICELLNGRRLTGNELLAVKRLENSLDGLDPLVQFMVAEEFAGRLDINEKTPHTEDLELLVGIRPWDGDNVYSVANTFYRQQVNFSLPIIATGRGVDPVYGPLDKYSSHKMLRHRRLDGIRFDDVHDLILGLHFIASIKAGELSIMEGAGSPFEAEWALIHFTRASAIMKDIYGSGSKPINDTRVATLGKIFKSQKPPLDGIVISNEIASIWTQLKSAKYTIIIATLLVAVAKWNAGDNRELK